MCVGFGSLYEYAFLMVLSTVLFVGRVSWKIVAISVGNDSSEDEEKLIKIVLLLKMSDIVSFLDIIKSKHREWN